MLWSHNERKRNYLLPLETNLIVTDSDVVVVVVESVFVVADGTLISSL